VKSDWNTAPRSFEKNHWSEFGLVVAIDYLDQLQLVIETVLDCKLIKI